MKVRWRLFSDESEPTSRERGGNVFRELARQGVDAAAWDLTEKCDIIVIQYNMRDIDAALAAAPIVVFDCNDMVFSDTWAGGAKTVRDGIPKVQAIVAGSPRLYEHLQRMHPFVTMIEQPVGPQYLTVKPKKHIGTHIFWMGMHDNIRYFSEIDGVLEQLARDHEFTVHFCTSVLAGDRLSSNAERVAAKPYPTKFHEWSIDGALKVMAGCDIGAAPLFQNEWAWCKCANKALNMMAAGLPVVVSDVPAYRAVITDEVDGFLAFVPEDWYDPLELLLTDSGTRGRIGVAGKLTAMEYTVEVIAKQWKAFLEGLL
jgi:glycosyltransferase involved in cell wall biosynthesis